MCSLTNSRPVGDLLEPQPRVATRTDPAKTSEIEVRFIAETPEQTRVVLEHRNLDRHGEGYEDMRDAVGSPSGWDGGLHGFATRLKGD